MGFWKNTCDTLFKLIKRSGLRCWTWPNCHSIPREAQPLSYQGRCPRAFNFTCEWHRNIEITRAYLEKAAKHMKKWADHGRRDQQFEVGDLVLVKLMAEQLKFLRNRDHRLVRKYEGPVPIVAKVGNNSYKIKPPTWMKVHPVFHVSNLKPFHADPMDASRGLPVRDSICTKPPLECKVDEILAERVVTVSKKPIREYLVRWEGLQPEETSWEREHDLKAFRRKIEEFQTMQSTRTSKN
ncbi:hypothetical protein V6N13_021077 [Hibiscus sabdariffa]